MEKTLASIAKLISLQGNVPKAFGAFHIICTVCTLITTFIFIWALRKGDKRTEKTLFLIAALVIIVGELYNQFVLSFEHGYFQFNIFFFPLQFCSTPTYVYPLALFIKNEKLYDGVVFYSATYCFLAGVIVFIYPESIFCNSLGISLQSTVHHGIMIALGAALLIKHLKSFKLSGFLYGLGIFVFFEAAAIIYNTAFGDKTNMYYLNPNSPVKVPVISDLLAVLPAPVVYAMYVTVFSAAAILISGLFLPSKVRDKLFEKNNG